MASEDGAVPALGVTHPAMCGGPCQVSGVALRLGTLHDCDVKFSVSINSVQSLSRVQLFATP